MNPQTKNQKQPKKRKRGKVLDRFFYYQKELPNGCIKWTGSLTKWGYGQFQLGTHGAFNINVRAHIFAYTLYYKKEPLLNLHHTCENKWCVNPLHLEEKDNSEHAYIHKGKQGRRINA